MTHELILTSVSQGLEQDSQGFCVVGSNKRIPPALVKRLKPISNYRHIFSPGSEEAKHHPVVYSHLIVPTPETSWHVLSRIADTGWDYAHEANHLAHHIALYDEEKVEEGPAWLLGLYGFHLTEWFTPPVRFDLGRPIPSLTAPPPLTRRQRIARERFWLDHRKTALTVPASEEPESLLVMARENEEQMVLAGPPTTPCSSWQEMLGDPGWGGILAETIRTAQPAVIVYRPGMNILPLFIEALSILPREQAWKATFTTYFTGLPEHVPCQWKGVVEGSPEAEALSRQGDHLVIDLTIPMGEVPSGVYVDYARHGIENMLPENESDDSVFVSNEPGTTTFFFSDENDASKSSGVSLENATTVIQPGASLPDAPPIQAFQDDDTELLNIAPQDDSDLIPPIIPPKTVEIRTRSDKDKGGLRSVLNMKSRGQFYLLYAATLVLVLFLITLVLDQVLDLGIARLFQRTSSSATQAASIQDKKAAGRNAETNRSKTTGENENSDGKLSDDAIQRKQEQLKKQQEARARIAARQKEKLLKSAQQARKDFETKTQKSKAELSEYLLDFSLPASWALEVPNIRGTNIIPPEKPQLLPEFASLHPFGLGLNLSLVPLLDIPNVRIVTERRILTKKIDLNSETPKEEAEKETVSSKLDGETADSASVQADASSSIYPADGSDDFLVPETDRFEWEVFAVDRETENKTPMFRLNLTEAGLNFEWLRDGMQPQHLFNTLWSSLGFLRVSVEGEKDLSRFKSIALFAPKLVEPIVLSTQFAEAKGNPLTVETPFAGEPWKTLWESPQPPFSLRIDGEVIPDSPSGIEEIEIPEDRPPSRFFANFHTGISSKKSVRDGQDSYSPVIVSFEGAADPEKIVWSDRYEDQIQLLKKEQEDGKFRSTDLDKELEAIKKQILNSGSSQELRTKRNDLSQSLKTLKSRLDEINNILENLPAAHQKILQNKDIRFEYAVYLEHIPSNGESTDSEHSEKRLKSEESILLMKSSGASKTVENDVEFDAAEPGNTERQDGMQKEVTNDKTLDDSTDDIPGKDLKTEETKETPDEE